MGTRFSSPMVLVGGHLRLRSVRKHRFKAPATLSEITTTEKCGGNFADKKIHFLLQGAVKSDRSAWYGAPIAINCVWILAAFSPWW